MGAFRFRCARPKTLLASRSFVSRSSLRKLMVNRQLNFTHILYTVEKTLLAPFINASFTRLNYNFAFGVNYYEVPSEIANARGLLEQAFSGVKSFIPKLRPTDSQEACNKWSNYCLTCNQSDLAVNLETTTGGLVSIKRLYGRSND